MASHSRRSRTTYFGEQVGAGRSAAPAPLTFNWRLLGIVGGAMLLLALWMNPGSARPAREAERATEVAAALSPAHGAEGATEVAPALSPALGELASAKPAKVERFSMIDLVGKLSLAVLLLYGVSFGLMKAKSLGFLNQFAGASQTMTEGQRLRLRETLPLGRQDGTLYLLELDGQMLLVGAATDQLQLLWSTAPEQTSSFAPVDHPTPEPQERTPKLPVAEDLPLFQRGFGQAPRKEADWAKERSRLISALAQAE
jgi:hypothetical protein